MYIYHNLKTGEYKAYTSRQALADQIGISKDTLANKFSRDKKTTWTTKDAEVITKTTAITNKRQKK